MEKDILKKAYYYNASKIDDTALQQGVSSYPDAYQYERAQHFNCIEKGIGKALERLGITQKNILKYPKADKNGFKSHNHRPYSYDHRESVTALRSTVGNSRIKPI